MKKILHSLFRGKIAMEIPLRETFFADIVAIAKILWYNKLIMENLYLLQGKDDFL